MGKIVAFYHEGVFVLGVFGTEIIFRSEIQIPEDCSIPNKQGISWK
jgi:hypothetical protein